jgi:hypothetical protein
MPRERGPSPLEFYSSDELLSEFVKRHDAFVLIYRKDEEIGASDEPLVTYSASGGGIYEVVGMLRYALMAIESKHFAAPVVIQIENEEESEDDA